MVAPCAASAQRPCEERDRRWAQSKTSGGRATARRAVGEGCARSTNCSSRARWTPATSTRPRCVVSSPKAGSAASPRASTPTSVARWSSELAHSVARMRDNAPACLRAAGHPPSARRRTRRLRRGGRRHRCRRHAAVGRRRRQGLPQGRGDELRAGRRLERARRRHQRAGYRAGTRTPRCRSAAPSTSRGSYSRGVAPRFPCTTPTPARCSVPSTSPAEPRWRRRRRWLWSARRPSPSRTIWRCCG